MNQFASESQVDETALGKQYDEYYYQHCLGPPCAHGSRSWQAFFGAVAEAIVLELRPQTVLDAGCGLGILVGELRRRKVDTWGLDLSTIAISHVPSDLKPYCSVGSILDPFSRNFDLITCIEVLEHLPAELAGLAISLRTGNLALRDEQRRLTAENSRLGGELTVIRDELTVTRDELTSTTDALSSTRNELASSQDEVIRVAAALGTTNEELAQVARERAVRIGQEWDWSSPGFRLYRACAGLASVLAPPFSRRARLASALLAATADGIDGWYLRLLPARRNTPAESAERRWDVSADGASDVSAPAELPAEPVPAAPSEVPQPADSGQAPSSEVPQSVDPEQDAPSQVAQPAELDLPAPSQIAEVDSAERDRGGAEQPEPLSCQIDSPAVGSTVRTFVKLSGWAADLDSSTDAGVDEVRVSLDDLPVGVASYGFTRRDVAQYLGSERFVESGWYFALDVKDVAAGPHDVQVSARSSVSGAQATCVLPLFVAEPEGLPEPRAATRQRFALFVAGSLSDSARYRCDHAVEQLGMLGVSADSVLYEKVALGDALDEYQLFILQRVPFNVDVAWFLEQAHGQGKMVLYDADDLIFDLHATRYIAGLDDMTERQREEFLESMVRCREALQRCDGVLVSTEPLRQLAQEFEKPVAVVHNVVSMAMLGDADAALRWSKHHREHAEPDTSPVTIAYLSGTATHNRDFLEAADSVIWALETYPHLRFITVGPIALDDRFARHYARIERLPLQPWWRLPDVLARADISLAPLEPFNPFTDSKSCIKYLEAALLGVPTVASPRADLARTIQPGVNGFLADSPDEWRDALRLLIESAELRASVGARARQDVQMNHSTTAAAPALGKTIRDLAAQVSANSSLTINWVVSPAAGSVDAAHVAMVSSLADRGHSVRVCLEPAEKAAAVDLVALTGRLQQQVAPGIAVYDGDLHELPAADVSIATDWRTADRVERHELSLFKVHLIREFEPELYSQNARLAREVERVCGLALRLVCADRNVAQGIARYTSKPIDCLDAATDSPMDQLERLLVEACFARLN
ncbi:MAG: glycosyltransferase [Chloroflexi bacterium]|nr:glycosyltransferase [Chloroflexota bacterium]